MTAVKQRKVPQPKQKRRPKAMSSAPPPSVQRHPLFGKIPLLPETWTDATGKERVSYAYDLDYQPELPKGAVRGNVRRQHFCIQCHVPRYFYVDLQRVCEQCKSEFVFSGKEQKYWYETLQFHFDSVAKHCPDCRKKRRSAKIAQEHVAKATAEAQATPKDPAKQLALAEAVIRLLEARNEGSLEKAVAACRRARRLARDSSRPEPSAAMFWEAKAQALAGRVDAATKLYESFLASAATGRDVAPLKREAKAWLTSAPRA
jgi:hypothetical protein